MRQQGFVKGLLAAMIASGLALSASAQPVNMTVDASKTGAPISKYMYGFFWWRPVGPDEFVVMDRERAYVGEHSPMPGIDPASGQRQASPFSALFEGNANPISWL